MAESTSHSDDGSGQREDVLADTNRQTQPTSGESAQSATPAPHPLAAPHPAPAQNPAPTHHPQRNGKLPVLAFLSGRGTETAGGSRGLVGAMILGAVAMVVALMALTIAIGRAPQEVSALPSRTSSQPTPVAPTTYASPEQTGTRWEAQPIITGVPQKPPSYEPIPTPTPSEKDSDRRSPGQNREPREEQVDD